MQRVLTEFEGKRVFACMNSKSGHHLTDVITDEIVALWDESAKIYRPINRPIKKSMPIQHFKEPEPDVQPIEAETDSDESKVEAHITHRFGKKY